MPVDIELTAVTGSNLSVHPRSGLRGIVSFLYCTAGLIALNVSPVRAIFGGGRRPPAMPLIARMRGQRWSPVSSRRRISSRGGTAAINAATSNRRWTMRCKTRKPAERAGARRFSSRARARWRALKPRHPADGPPGPPILLQNGLALALTPGQRARATMRHRHL